MTDKRKMVYVFKREKNINIQNVVEISKILPGSRCTTIYNNHPVQMYNMYNVCVCERTCLGSFHKDIYI